MSRTRKTNIKEASNVANSTNYTEISPYNEEANMAFSYIVSAGSMIANKFITSDDEYPSLLNNYLKIDVNINAIKDCLENLFTACEMVKDNSSIDNLRIADKMYLDFTRALQVTFETALVNIRYGLMNRVKEVLLNCYPDSRIMLPSEYSDQGTMSNINYILSTNGNLYKYLYNKEQSFRENNKDKDRMFLIVNLSDMETQDVYIRISRIIASILNANPNIIDPYALQIVLTNLHVDFIDYHNSIVELLNWVDKIYDIICSNTDIYDIIEMIRENRQNNTINIENYYHNGF